LRRATVRVREGPWRQAAMANCRALGAAGNQAFGCRHGRDVKPLPRLFTEHADDDGHGIRTNVVSPNHRHRTGRARGGLDAADTSHRARSREGRSGHGRFRGRVVDGGSSSGRTIPRDSTGASRARAGTGTACGLGPTPRPRGRWCRGVAAGSRQGDQPSDRSAHRTSSRSNAACQQPRCRRARRPANWHA
jgi:hypothetical protein